jgi:6-phosphogluconate dehydrogenase
MVHCQGGLEMQLGMIGLGRMGANMVRRLHRGGHSCVVYDRDATLVAALAKEGLAGAASLDELSAKLAPPRAAWVMVPAGTPTEETVTALGERFSAGDMVIDGGNSYYKDDVRRARLLEAKGVRYLDAGTSGGVWGLERGYCLMIGGERQAFEHLLPIWNTLAPGRGDIPPTPGRGPMQGTAEQG